MKVSKRRCDDTKAPCRWERERARERQRDRERDREWKFGDKIGTCR